MACVCLLLRSSPGSLFAQWLNGQAAGLQEPLICSSKPFLFSSYKAFGKDDHLQL